MAKLFEPGEEGTDHYRYGCIRAFYPPDAPATELIASLGRVLEIRVADQLNAFSTANRGGLPRLGDSMHRGYAIMTDRVVFDTLNQALDSVLPRWRHAAMRRT